MLPSSRLRAAFLRASIACAAMLVFVSCDSEDNGTDPMPTGPAHSGAMVLVKAKGQSFQMGSATGNADEQPVHAVGFTRDFWMDTTEVTQSEFDRVMKAAFPSYSTPDWNTPYGVGARTPAYLVEWGDAVLYCNARSRAENLDTVYAYSGIRGTPGNGCELDGVAADLTKSGYRLPTEAEWEYACRAGGSFDFFWGKNGPGYPATAADSAEMDRHAVWAGNSWYLGSDDARFGVQAAASRAPNAFGLYDMTGNTWEWCHDWYDAAYYAASAAVDPAGPATGGWHTLRGGSWGNEAMHLRATNRTFSTPDYLYNFIGFRAVRTAQ